MARHKPSRAHDIEISQDLGAGSIDENRAKVPTTRRGDDLVTVTSRDTSNSQRPTWPAADIPARLTPPISRSTMTEVFNVSPPRLLHSQVRVRVWLTRQLRARPAPRVQLTHSNAPLRLLPTCLVLPVGRLQPSRAPWACPSSFKISNVNIDSVYLGYRFGLIFLAKIDAGGCRDFR